MVRTSIAYCLWALLGVFGAHHIYLKRYCHAFVWMCTFGGFIFGWLRDLFSLGDYIKLANEDKDHLFFLQTCRQRYKAPKSSWTRIIGEIAVGFLFCVVYRGALPEEWISNRYENWMNFTAWCLTYLTPSAIALGVYVVGSIGHHVINFNYCVLISYATSIFISFESDNTFWNVVVVVILVNKYAKTWRFLPNVYTRSENGAIIQQSSDFQDVMSRRPKLSRKKALIIIFVCFSIYCSLWMAGIWFNTYITTKDGERIRVKDAVTHFFNSPAWKRMLSTLKELYEYWREHGTRRLYQEFIKALDPEGEENAYSVLELPTSATDADIRARCRSLMKEHHPDKVQDPDLKEKAHSRFIEVQGACQILDKVRVRRREKSRSSDEL